MEIVFFKNETTKWRGAKMVLLVGGLAGTGKSLLKDVAGQLGLTYYSAGNLWREISTERGVTPEMLGVISKTDPTVDKLLDDRTKALASQKEDFVLESRLGPFFVKNRPTCKIILLCHEEVRIRRLMTRECFQELSFAEVKKITLERERIDAERYLQLYGIENCFDTKVYDYAILTSEDVSDRPKEWVKNQILHFYQKSRLGA